MLIGLIGKIHFQLRFGDIGADRSADLCATLFLAAGTSGVVKYL
jgi:hypothetical protein